VLAGAILLLVVLVGLVAMRLWPDQVRHFLDRAIRLEHDLGASGWLVAACAQVVIALCGVLPASIGAFAAGLAYGIAGGFVISGSATLLAAVLAFVLARRLFRPMAERLVTRYTAMARLDDAVRSEGWRLVVLLRLSPIMPFALTSYALGLTSLPLRTYVAGTLASLPALLGYVALGHFTAVGFTFVAAGQSSPLRWALLTFTLAVTALLTVRLALIARVVLSLPVK